MKTAKQNTVANISQPAGSNISQQITQNPIQNDAVSSFFAGLYSSLDIRDAYTEALAERFHGGNLLAVVDGGNGAAGELACHVLSRIGARIIPLYCEPDGHFPHHHPDPIEEANCRDLREAVLAHGADLGIGLDGDGDRLAVIDRNGRQLASDELLSLFAHDLLFRHAQNGAGRKEPILADVKCSRRLLQEIESLGGCPILCPTGHSLMKEAMRRENALIGGELAGHYFHAENWFGFDDGIFSAAKVLHILSSQHFTLEEIPHWEPAYATPELKVPCSEAEKFHVVERAREYFSQLEDCTVCTVDGVRVEFEDSWFLVRASNTGPHICLRLEAPSAEKLDVMRRDLEKLVQGWVQ